MSAPPLQDASTPAPVKGVGNPNVTASFSPPPGSVIFAICEADESNTFAVTDNLTPHLTWTSIGVSTNQAGQGSIMVFRAPCPNGASNMTITSTRTGSFTAHGLIPVVFTGAEMGAFTGAKITGFTATVNITTTGPDSQVYAGHIEEGGGADTAATGCTFWVAETSFGGIGGGGLKRTVSVPVTGTTVAIGVTGSTTPAIVAFEVKSAPDPAPALRLVGPGLSPFSLAQPWMGTGSDVVSTAATGAIAIQSTAAMTLGPTLEQMGALPIQGTSALTLAATLDQHGVLPIAAAGSMALNGTVIQSGALPISAAAAVSLAAVRGVVAALPVAAAGALTLGATLDQHAALAIQGTAALTLDGTVTRFAVLPVQGTAALVFGATLDQHAALAIGAQAAVALAGTVTQFGIIPIQANAALALGALLDQHAILPIGSQAQLQLTAGGGQVGAISIQGTAAVTLGGVREVPAALAIGGTATVTLAAVQERLAALGIQGSAAVTLAGVVGQLAILAIQGTGTVAVNATLQLQAVLAILGHGTLQPTPGGTLPFGHLRVGLRQDRPLFVVDTRGEAGDLVVASRVPDHWLGAGGRRDP